nr:PAS domain S-box protein [uncultured Methanoregula sp.]
MPNNVGAPAVSKILYVDDEPGLLEIGKLFLEDRGSFTVDTSPSAPDALELLVSRQYDAIVSDFEMPKMNGIAFLKTLRMRGDTTPFIIFTGRGREEVVIEALNSGADFYLQKGGDPISQFAELEHKILRAISNKQADLALKKSEQDYRHLIEHASEAIFIIQDEVFRLVNPQAARLSGYPELELLNQPFLRFVHPDDGAQLISCFRKRSTGSEVPSHYTFRIIRRDATIRWVELSVVAITWNGNPAILNFMTDITDRKLAQDALSASEQNYRHLIEHAGEAIFVTQDEIFRLVNPQLIRFSGYSEQELLGQPFTRFVHPDNADMLLDNYRKRIAGSNIPSQYTFRIIRKDGEVRWVELSVVVITWDERPAILNFLTDITDRKHSEDALRESEERYRQFFRTTLDGLFITTVDGQWIDFNDAIVGMFGCKTRDEVFGTPIRSFYVNPEDRAAIVRRVEQEGYVKEYPLSYRRRDGMIFAALMTVIAQKNPDGSTRMFIGTLRDITDRKRTEDALRESEERYRQFFRTTLDGLFITTMDGQWIDFNDAIMDLIGYAGREEVFSTPIISLYVHPEERAAFIERVERDGYVKEYPVQLTKRDGTVIDTLMTVALQENPDDSGKRLIGTIRDVTEHKRTGQALRESEERYRRIFESFENL